MPLKRLIVILFMALFLASLTSLIAAYIMLGISIDMIIPFFLQAASYQILFMIISLSPLFVYISGFFNKAVCVFMAASYLVWAAFAGIYIDILDRDLISLTSGYIVLISVCAVAPFWRRRTSDITR